MKQFVFLALVFFLLFFGCDAQKVYNRTTKYNGKDILIGQFKKEALMKEPFKQWFEPEYNDYQMDSALIKPLQTKLRLYRFKVFMGTWCGDSRREIPRFIKLLDQTGFSVEQRADFYGVNRKKESFHGEEIGLDIIRVPTIIIYKGNKEINRIVEYPVSKSLEQDIYTILSGEKYKPNYAKD